MKVQGRYFLIQRGTQGDISDALKDFLSYIEGSNSHCELTKNIDSRVSEARDNNQWRRDVACGFRCRASGKADERTGNIILKNKKNSIRKIK